MASWSVTFPSFRVSSRRVYRKGSAGLQQRGSATRRVRLPVSPSVLPSAAVFPSGVSRAKRTLSAPSVSYRIRRAFSVGCQSFFSADWARLFVSIVFPNTTNRSYRYSVTKFSSMFRTVTTYPFHPQVSVR